MSGSIGIAVGVGGERLLPGGKEKSLEELGNGRCLLGTLTGLLELGVLRVGGLVGSDGIRNAGRQNGFEDFVHVGASRCMVERTMGENVLFWMP